jgi:hypothetical protein
MGASAKVAVDAADTLDGRRRMVGRMLVTAGRSKLATPCGEATGVARKEADTLDPAEVVGEVRCRMSAVAGDGVEAVEVFGASGSGGSELPSTAAHVLRLC